MFGNAGFLKFHASVSKVLEPHTAFTRCPSLEIGVMAATVSVGGL